MNWGLMWVLVLLTLHCLTAAAIPAVMMGGISWLLDSPAWPEIASAVFVWRFFDEAFSIDAIRLGDDDGPDDDEDDDMDDGETIDGYGTGT